MTQAVVDGAVFANAAELSSWADTRVQVYICEACGIEHCASGGWLMARNVGVGVAFVPAFGEMLGGDWEQVEYAPPYFAQGMPVFTPSDYAKLRRWCLGLPADPRGARIDRHGTVALPAVGRSSASPRNVPG